MNLFGIRRSERERDRQARTSRRLTLGVESCEPRLSLSGIVGNHIGAPAMSGIVGTNATVSATDVLGRKH
jgi:hypothetical protein